MKYDDVENARKVYINKYKSIKYKTLLISGGMVVVFVVWVIMTNSNLGWQNYIFNIEYLPYILPAILPAVIAVVSLPLILAFVFARMLAAGELGTYKKIYKAYFVERQLANVFTDLEYSHDKGLERGLLMYTSMIDTGDKYYSNDYVSGRYNNVKFAQADVEIKKEREGKGSDHDYENIFKGRYMIFEFPKKFHSRMMLTHRGTPLVKRNSESKMKELHRIKTESEDFNEAFMIYAEDDVEALYILTPDFMENVLFLGEEHNNKVSLYFHDNKMLIGINDGNDIFEPPNPKAPIDEKREIERVGKEMHFIINIIDNLKLNK